MLERAPTYFEHGGRQFIRASAIQSVRGSRALHAPLGHHGPVPQPSTRFQSPTETLKLQGDASSQEESSIASGACQAEENGPFLDFLYPSRTLALMRKFHYSNRGAWRVRSLSISTVGRRHYSSKRTSGAGPTGTDAASEKGTREGTSDKAQATSSKETSQIPGLENDPKRTGRPQDESPKSEEEDARQAVDMTDVLNALDDNYVYEEPGDQIGSDMDAYLEDLKDEGYRGLKTQQPEIAADEGHLVDVVELIETTEANNNKPEALSKLIEYYSDTNVARQSRDVLPQAIWRLWNTLSVDEKTPKLATELLKHLGSLQPFLRTHAERILQIFEPLPSGHRVSQAYNSAILAYLTLKGSAKAALLYFEGMRAAESRQTAPNSVLGLGAFGESAPGKLRPTVPEPLISRAIAEGEWQLAVEVVSTARQLGDINWDAVGKDLDLHDRLTMFLLRLGQLDRLRSTPVETREEIEVLAVALSKLAVAQMTNAWSSKSSQGHLWRLLLRIKRCGYVPPAVHAELHALAVESILHAEEITKFPHLPPIVFRLYETYVSAKLEKIPAPARSSTFVCMLHGFLRHPRIPPKQTIDTGKVYFHQKLVVGGRPPVSMLSLLMHYHANQGDEKKVNVYFQEFLRHWGKEGISKNRAIFRSMFYVLSRKGDVAGQDRLILYMRMQFDLTPDPQSWNSVLKAHAKNDDLAGAWERLRYMTKVTKLDGNSFRIILELFAARGDVDAVKEIFDMISDLDPDILRDARTAIFLVLAHIKNGELREAEQFAMQMKELKDQGQLFGDTTIMWNTLASEYARQRDVQAVQRIMAFMTEHQIPFDAYTYAALLLALANIHQTDVAYKILRQVIPKEPIERLALHYAIVMGGYINQRRYIKVWYVDRHRQHQRIPATFSTRSALVQAVLLHEANVGGESGSEEFEKSERMVLGQMQLLEPWEIGKEVQFGKKFTPANQLRDTYLDLLILTFGQKRMFDMSQRLFDLYAKRGEIDFSTPEKTPPMRMLVALMNNFLNAQQYAEVEQCWLLAKKQADDLSEMRPANVASEFASQEPKNRKAPSRRRIITGALHMYMVSLKQQNRIEDMQQLITSMLDEGYELSNSIWNNYIQLLARSGRIAHAFSLTEMHLMTRWPGWRNPRYAKRKRHNRGWDYVYVSALREAPGAKLPTYRTMVFLAAALKYVRRAEAIGGGSGTMVTEAFLEKRAPITIKATRTMPRIDDSLQTNFLGGDM
ncbi:hypothetical protein HDK77DRAFT_452076 [Phyllosticta capitalensis]|uniref:Pentatricopeptide repeat protein n=1 Tax=Phyllosticta capitalensis TaxID=121624 RepID=A0ABR1Y9J8_9PEZI